MRQCLAYFVQDVTGLSPDDPGDGSARIAWDDNDQGPMPKPNVSIGFISDVSQGFPNEDTRTVPITQRLTITQTVVGESVVCNLIWAEVRTNVELGDDLTATRDKFLLAMQAKIDRNVEPLTLAVDGAASILVSGLSYSIPDIEAVIGCELDDPPPAEAVAEITSTPVAMRVRVQLFGFKLSSDPAEDDVLKIPAIEKGRMARRAFEERRGLDALKDYGLGVQGTPATLNNVTLKSGGLREIRVFFDITIVTRESYYLFAAQEPSVDETIDQVDPPSIEGAFV